MLQAFVSSPSIFRPPTARHAAFLACLAAILVGSGPGPAIAQVSIVDISPDSSVINQPQNGSQGGRVNGLKVIDDNGTTLAYAASEWGGLFKSTDGAQTWVHLDGHLPQATFDVDVDPNDPDLVYATSMHDGRADSLGGINVSRDGGATWEHPVVPDTNPSCGTWSQPSAFGISIQPGPSPNIVIIGTSCGVAVSDDEGMTWTHVDPDPATNFRRIWDVVASGNGIVDICGTDGHHRSVNDGQSWTPSNAGANPLPTGRDVCSIAASPLESSVLFVTQVNGNLWESSDGGLMWTPLDDGLGNRRPFVVTNQVDDDTFDLYFGDGQKLRRVDDCDDTSVPTRCPADGNLTDGINLGTIISDPDVHADAGDLEFEPTGAMPRCLYLYSNDGGVYRATNCSGTSWTRAMVGLHDTWLFGLATTLLPGPETGIYFGLMDSGMWYSTDGGSSWGNPRCCDIFDMIADPDRIIFTLCCAGSSPFNNLWTAPADDPSNISSMNAPPSGWLQWFQLQDSMAPYDTDSYVVITQTDGNALFETANGNGSGGVWITDDVGASYTELGVATTPANACAVKVSVSGGTPTFYVLTDDALNGSPRGLCSGRDGGRLWKYTGTDPNDAWTAADSGLTAVGVFGVDPNDPDRLYASDITASGPRMVFSEDGGASWSPDTTLDLFMTGNGEFAYSNTRGPEVRWFTPPLRGYVQPTVVSFHPTNPDVLVAGATDAGLFLSTDGGQAWALVTDELRRPRYVSFDPQDTSVFYLGTIGRGAWKIDLPSADLAISKSDSPDPVAAGTNLTYTLDVSNDGPGDAPNVTVIDTLPDGVAYVSDTQGCEEGPGQTLVCELGDVIDQGMVSFDVVVAVAPDLVFDNMGPKTITNNASVGGVAIDPDPENTVMEDTLVVAVADLEIVSFEAVDPPSEILVGEDVDVTLEKVITNHGPSWPMNVELTTEATAAQGATVEPENLVLEEPALELDELRMVEEDFTISCQEASSHPFEFENTIAPLDPADTDPDLSNNVAELELPIECVVPVVINIKAGSYPNSINMKSTVPVTILSTMAGEYGTPLDFDATSILPETVRFGPRDDVFFETGGAAKRHKKAHIEDSFEPDEQTQDGDEDLVLHFLADETGIQPGDDEACVKGQWEDDQGGIHKFFGCDTIRTVPSL